MPAGLPAGFLLKSRRRSPRLGGQPGLVTLPRPITRLAERFLATTRSGGHECHQSPIAGKQTGALRVNTAAASGTCLGETPINLKASHALLEVVS